MKKILIFLLLSFSSISQSNEIDLIYSYNINVEYFGNIELVSIFTRKITRWPTGERIKVFIKSKNSFEHNSFTSIVLGMTVYRYKRMLDKQLYNGGKSPPIIMNTDEKMIEAIKFNEYSIGYLNYGIAIFNIGGTNIRIIKL